MSIAEHPSTDRLLQSAADHLRAGAVTQAESLCRQILRQNPTHAEALALLARIAARLGNLGLSVAFLTKASAAAPEDPSYPARLGLLYLRSNQLQQAAAHFERALELDPRYSPAYVNLGVARLSEGRVDEAVATFRKGLQVLPDDADIHSNLLFALHYQAAPTRVELYELARKWGQRHAWSGASFRQHANCPDAERRLRIGYVSGNFAAHPVGYFLSAVLAAHQRESFELFCYTNRRRVDHVTEQLRGNADHWRDITDLDDETAAQRIRQDRIDILIDLAGHTNWHRLRTFALKPAPVQATWMGYFDTTGIEAIDYLIADRFICPPGDDCYYTEKVVRLPDCYLCYSPQTDLEVSPPPVLKHGAPTFACFNKLAKITPDVIRTWSRILAAVPDARLQLKDGALAHAEVRDRVWRQFAEKGIPAARVELHGRSSYQEYLASYGQVDIALDPFPYNGGTTTVEALWMGVPVVSLAGERFVSRMGLAHLTTIGAEELVARSVEEYVTVAVRLAGDAERLARLRGELRSRVRVSPLCDGRRFVDGLETAYREMWRAWCATQVSDERSALARC